MPYARESAGKGGHSDFIKNPDVASFLSQCTYLRQPSDHEAAAIGSRFEPAPYSNPSILPRYVLASDASKSDTPISDRLPSTQIGFLKVSHLLINMASYAGLLDPANRFVDPFKAAEIQRDSHPVTFTMPGSNVRYKGCNSVKDGFRTALFDQLCAIGDQGGGRSVAQVLVALDGGALQLAACPACRSSVSASFSEAELFQDCVHCGQRMYATDALRLHEGISDFGDNASAMTRMMNAVEHLLLAHFIMQVWQSERARLSDIAFVMDGPLAIFGEPAKLSQRLQRLIHSVNADLAIDGLPPMLVLGLQKTGGLMDHAMMIDRHIRPGTLRVVDDEYRNTYITGADTPAQNFGNETYYGQDFIFKTERGRIFNFAISYPFPDKSSGKDGSSFSMMKTKMSSYGSLLQQACDLIRHFEMDLYDSAIVPVALAHRHASISFMPGGKVLDLLARSALASS